MAAICLFAGTSSMMHARYMTHLMQSIKSTS